ncbi:MAG: Uma2 family endonuclease [Spirochaetota bacterium]
MRRMGYPAVKKEKQYTYADYMSWPEDERWEIIEGVAWNMSAAPNTHHQRISRELFRQIINYLHGKTCEVFLSPFDVILPEYPEQPDDEVITVVQPDITVICDSTKLTRQGLRGSPDLIIEILSPYTAKKDLNEKLLLYEKHSVHEYWVVDPGNEFVHVYLLDERCRYPENPKVYFAEDAVASAVCEGLVIRLKEVFLTK